MSTISRTINDLTRKLGNAVMDRYNDKVAIDTYVAELKGELGKYNLNDPQFIDDIARSFVRSDIAQRSNVDPFVVDKNGLIQPALFRRARFRRGVIRLGPDPATGKIEIVKMSEATAQQWIVRQIHQQLAANAAQIHATRTSQFLRTEPGILLMEHKDLRTREAMAQLSLWPEGFEGIDEDDDEPDDEGA